MNSTDEKFMGRALELAAKAKGRTSPNPMVGCVIVRDGAVIGEGYHEKAGEDHAEVKAVRVAQDITGATVYVSLEPCCVAGKTPPCLAMLLEKKPARVVVAMKDPNPDVSGRSIETLREAGIEVEEDVLGDAAQSLNEVFSKYITTHRPFVIAKCAMTLDGKIATRTGDSKWVTSEAARRMVHELRDEMDGILVGSRTVMMDDPSLTTRLEEKAGRDPIRIILDGDDYLAKTQKVFSLASSAPTWVVVPEGHTFEGADDVLHIPSNGVGLNLNVLMDDLGARGVTSILIEGGGATHASAFEAGIVDKVMFFIAPKVVGGHDAVSAVGGRGVDLMSDAIQLEKMTARPVGEDLLIEAYVRKD